jgi:hypothetical protein
MPVRFAPLVIACVVCATPALAQVSTFTAGGGGPVLLAKTAVRPASRAFVGPTYVNVHQDRAPGVAEALAPVSASRLSKPMAYGASPLLADLYVPMNIGPTSIAFDPWTTVEGYGDLETIEAARVDFLERYGLLGGVRTHGNSAAEVMGEIAEPVGEPRGVIRVRPERDDSQELVNAGR